LAQAKGRRLPWALVRVTLLAAEKVASDTNQWTQLFLESAALDCVAFDVKVPGPAA